MNIKTDMKFKHKDKLGALGSPLLASKLQAAAKFIPLPTAN